MLEARLCLLSRREQTANRLFPRGVDHPLDRKRSSNDQVAVIEFGTLIRRSLGPFARHRAKLGQTFCAEHKFQLEGTNIEDGQKSILQWTAALVLIRTLLVVDAQRAVKDADRKGTAKEWLQITKPFRHVRLGDVHHAIAVLVQEDAAVLFQSCRGAFPGREVRIRMRLLEPVLRVTVLGFIHVRLDEMGVLEDAISLDNVQVNAVRTAAAPAVVHRAVLFVPGVEYVIAYHQLCELLKGVIAEDASVAHGSPPFASLCLASRSLCNP
jgi:hypothetical protein